MLAELIDAFDRGSLPPLPSQVFAIAEAIPAFRLMAQAASTWARW